MLSREQNNVLCRVGPGTPMGELFRRCWLPAVLSKDVARPGGPQHRLRVLGEDLVAFRDTNGDVGIVSAYCSHRRAPLYFGRNEEGGLRCVYHGWKFNSAGECLEAPNIGSGRPEICKNLGITAYATHETAGVIWIYMGPREKQPPFPALEYAHVPDGQHYAASWLQRSNWSQGMEGEIDSSHISWLHRDFDRSTSNLKTTGGELADDGAPVIELVETNYGFAYGARRILNGEYFWRVTHWVAPMFSMIPRAPGVFQTAGGRAWVPIDDNHTTVFTFGYRVDRPFSAEEIATYESGALFPPRMSKGVYTLPDGYKIDINLPLAARENDFLIDREMQRNENFTGIWGIHDQDRALAESSKPVDPENPGVVDRSQEHLVSSDRPVVTARRRLLKMAQELAEGVEPEALRNRHRGVRAISKVCNIATFAEFLKVYGAEAGIEIESAGSGLAP